MNILSSQFYVFELKILELNYLYLPIKRPGLEVLSSLILETCCILFLLILKIYNTVFFKLKL